MRINGGIGKSKEECQVEWNEHAVFLEEIVKTSCKKFGCKDKTKTSRLYNKNGVDLGEDDMQFL